MVLPKCLLYIFIFSLSSTLFAQESVDGNFEFQSDPEKKYSIYVPSSYDASSPSAMMLGLHPFNTNRWDAKSWRDTLIVFAETNDLLLVCPDGGEDGKVDDAIDTAFTTVLLDSMKHWYNVDENAIYAMGFSWGGKTCYTYGLNHINTFAGIMPIGAAINGTNEIENIQSAATNNLFYIIHGSNDIPNTRFYPLVELLQNNDACVQSTLLEGVNHTIDFPNRNEILSDAYLWLKNTICLSQTESIFSEKSITISPNPAIKGQSVKIEKGIWKHLYDQQGKIILTNENPEGQHLIIPSSVPAGHYLLSITLDHQEMVKKLIISH